MKIYNDFCAITESSNSTFPKTRTAVKSFVLTNPWFNGIMIIMTLKNDSLNDNNIDILKSIYKNIEILEIDRDHPIIIELHNKFKKKESSFNVLDYLNVLCFNIKSEGNLYFSRNTLFLKDVSEMIDSDFLVVPSNSNNFPQINNFNNSDINSKLMFIPQKLINIINYSILLENIGLFNLSEFNSENKIFNEMIVKNNLDVRVVSNIFSCKSSTFPDPKYSNFIRYSKSIKALFYNTNQAGKIYSRIHTYWIQQNKSIADKMLSVENNEKLVELKLDKKSISISKLGIKPGKIDGYHLSKEEYSTIEKKDNFSNSKGLKSIYIAIPTYNRSELLYDLVNRISQYSDQYLISINIYDDCSDEDYSKVIEFLKSSNVNFSYRRNKRNLGKKLFSVTYNNIFRDVKDSNSSYYFQIPDDIDLVPNFFDIAIAMIESTSTEIINIGTMTFHTKLFEKRKTQKIRIGKYKFWKSNWVDGGYIATKGFFEKINYSIPIIDQNRWIKNPNKGSGTSGLVSLKYKSNSNLSILQVTKSLLIHKGHDSRLNPEFRHIEVCNSDLDLHPFNNKRVILVGPDPDLVKNGPDFGKYIDSFDIVIRTNGAYPVPKDMEDYYGKKCNVLVLNNAFCSAREFNFKIYEELGEVKYTYDFGALYDKGITSNKILFLQFDDDLDDYIYKYIGKVKDLHPFSGMYIISQVLKCNPSQFYVCGVSNYSNPGNSHFSGYLPSHISSSDIAPRQKKFHPNTRKYQSLYFSKLLNQGKIEMDDQSKKNF